MRTLFILSILLCLCFATGCEESDTISNETNEIDALSLFGLSNGRSLVYLQTDTTISPDSFTISISDTTLSILITGSGDDWIIHKSGEKLVNLKIASSSIIQNGYWKKFNLQDSLVYFATPPLLMERTLSANVAWDYYTPFYEPESTPMYLPYYYANFGFQVSKEYKGIETIITPAGEFDTYRFDLVLYTSAFGDDPIATISEYYVPNIGLVKQDFNNGALRRSIILANYTD